MSLLTEDGRKYLETIRLARIARNLASKARKLKGMQKQAFLSVIKSLAGVQEDDNLRIVRFARGCLN